ncbi:hypothetical protein BT63DRAFT_438677 [Microthyrium microscopicum]|uniref:Threonylcarbamoyl-AMP synthase n=1 Tax=Microthyrium microscopicum TaxID=703497 RepID=A0A6A6UFW2_9PEZI|nr:hypothetical protein BT63DRAFT_438677 [Microthyrium microscopicum]
MAIAVIANETGAIDELNHKRYQFLLMSSISALAIWLGDSESSTSNSKCRIFESNPSIRERSSTASPARRAFGVSLRCTLSARSIAPFQKYFSNDKTCVPILLCARAISFATAATSFSKPDTFADAVPLTVTMASESPQLDTRTLVIDPRDIGEITAPTWQEGEHAWIQDWSLKLNGSKSARHLQDAARQIRETDIPVAFPTETVYGLGADATRDSAVKGIFAAKRRPADNPLIVHFSSVQQLRDILMPASGSTVDPIPEIYRPLIAKFWPGPLTILLQLPTPSPFAPSVNATLPTFGARIPSNPIALALIHLAGTPVAAPSANASTRPSPTSADHVVEDLKGRINTVLDGGPCAVGVESTVVDGLSVPPVVLRPGGVSLEELRQCKGWENTKVAYKDQAQDEKPRAPGMKYRHYSPKASVYLYEHGEDGPPSWDTVKDWMGEQRRVGFVTTKTWGDSELFRGARTQTEDQASRVISSNNGIVSTPQDTASRNPMSTLLSSLAPVPVATLVGSPIANCDVWLVELGPGNDDIARGLFSALRELDRKGVATIFVEGIDDEDGDTAAAIMNRLRKAAIK